MFDNVKDLDKIPYLYLEYTCQTCKQVFSFLSGFRCNCESTHKFRAKKIIVNQINFPSYNEGKTYSKLAFLESKNIIKKLELQPKYPAIINGKVAFNYFADFRFTYDDKTETLDVKGKSTAVFKLKHKILKLLYPDLNLTLTQVGNKDKNKFKKNANFYKRKNHGRK